MSEKKMDPKTAKRLIDLVITILSAIGGFLVSSCATHIIKSL